MICFNIVEKFGGEIRYHSSKGDAQQSLFASCLQMRTQSVD